MLNFQTLEDSSSFLNVVKVCWEAEEKATAIVVEDSEDNEDNKDSEDNEEQFTQQWPESPLFL